MNVDDILTRISDGILSLQKLTNIWVFHATEDIRQEDVALVLPPEQGTSEDRTPITITADDQALKQVTVTKASVRERNLWRLCTVLFMVALTVYVLFFSPI